jgi:hypothetical protein
MPTPIVDPDGIVGWIAEHDADLGHEVISTVLDLEAEYMVGVGIMHSPDPDARWEFRFYDPDALEGEPMVVDVDRIAHDAEQLAGVPYEVALRVLDGELEFLHVRGLA